MSDKEIVRKFYDNNAQYEWERLDRHPIEFEVTKHFIDRYIEPGSKVLDIGGGPGRYSLYLAEKGCDVTLLDLSDANVLFAQDKAKELHLDIKTVQCDACNADKVISDTYDYVLLMGPMYHLTDEKERTQAMNAALKLLKPGGKIFVSFISLYAGVTYYMKNDPQGVMDQAEQEYLQCYLDNRTYTGDAFTRACFIAPKDILPYLEGFGLEKLHLLGQESITSPCENNIYACEPAILKRWIEIAIQTCEREEFLAYSEHIMFVGQK